MAVLFTLDLSPLGAADFYVAPHGNDAHPGTIDNPFATLTRARDAVRRLQLASDAIRAPIVVHIADGHYELSEPLELSAQDSGTPSAPVVYRAAQGARPIFSGGGVIQGWKQGNNGIWTAPIPKRAGHPWKFEQLFVNGERAVRARTPNQFYFYMQQVREENLGTERPDGATAIQHVRMRADHFRELASLSEDQLADVNMLVYHKWDNTRRFIDSLDRDTATLLTSGKPMKS